MSLYQNIVLNKHLSELEAKRATELDNLYESYSAYFLNPQIQENIRNSKEEQFQEGFLRELFVKILGYTLNPDADFNLVTERKNVGNAKKADGAILISGDVVGVIELKDHKTSDLRQVEGQAFGYKNNQRNCSYVIISNFEKLRFYVDNAVEVEEFLLFTLSRADFARLYLLLSYDSIRNGVPKQLKTESITKEEQITKDLYRDYSAFKRALFADLCERNTQYDKLTLFKKSQKLLDRLLFIFFAEDKHLLPANSILKIIEQWEKLNELDEYRPLYDRYKKYFGYLNTGHKGKTEEIFAYNGGLFAVDEVLDSVVIDDELLRSHTTKLAGYDFASEVDVNILGHIFENSLTEIEEVTNEITTGERVTSKRKKDGVFYTPRYITTYIVDNTLGRMCREKRAEMGIVEEEYFADKKRQLVTKKRLDDNLNQYRDWLLGLTICDPACGSGAFLNAALDYLMTEHRLIDEMTNKLLGYALPFPNVENAILERNLYGVDINDESIEIAKLALWLRTAQPHRKLTSLNNNIKCGNSLISDPAIAGDKAFDWQAEFPQVFEKGGFDIIIGNPPYVFARENFDIKEKSFFTANYNSAKYQINTYILFMEKSIILLKDNGSCGLIIPNSWLMVYSAEDLRRFLLERCTLNSVVNLSGKSFEDANVETVIFIAENRKSADNYVSVFANNDDSGSFSLLHTKLQSLFSDNKGYEFNVFSDDISASLIDKIKVNSTVLDEICSVKAGLQAYEKGKGTPIQSVEDVKNRPYDFDRKYNDNTYMYLEGGDVQRYGINWSGGWLWYGEHLAAPRTFNLFDGNKIIIREITGKYPQSIISVFSNDIYLYNRSNIAVINREEYSDVSLKYITTILNSSLISYYFIKNTAKAERKLFPKIILNDLRLFPIKYISVEEQQPFVEMADKMLELNKQLAEKRNQFITLLKNNLEGIKITKAIENFETLDFKGLLTEFKKQKITIPLTQQIEWQQAFDKYRTDCQTLTTTIASTDHQIDQMVYTLYNLTPTEIAIIEK